jgi:glycosidase
LACAALLLSTAAATADRIEVDLVQGSSQPKSACVGPRARSCDLRIYQVMVEAFVDGDPAHDYGDGYGTSHHRGDLRGIIRSLDYIAGLGMNALWLTPVFDSDAGAPQERLGGTGTDLKLDATGYFTRDYFRVDPRFGTLEDLRELVTEAHARGLYVLLDGVFGHHKGGLARSPEGRLPVDSTDPADYGGDPAGYPGRVVDYDAPETLAFFEEVARYWIREVGIDGWRLDQAYQVPLPAWRVLRDAVREEAAKRPGNPGYLVAEIFDAADRIRDDAFGPASDPALDSAFDFPVRYATVGVLAGEENGTSRRPPSVIDEPWAFGAHSGNYREDALPNLMLGNHDLVRFGDLLQRASIANPEDNLYWARHRLAFLLQGAYTGPITRYYGEELGDELPDYAARVTFDCANRGLCDDHVARTSGKVPGVTVNEADLSPDALELLDFHRAVMAARQALPALSHGSRVHLYSDNRVYADLKRYAGQEVVFVMNVTDQPHTLVLGEGLFETRTADAWDVLANHPVQAEGGALAVDLPPQSGRYLLLANEAPAALEINPGLNDAWFEPTTSGQGVFINVFPDRRQLFLAWFTFDAEASAAAANLGAPGHRWFTAFGPYQANLAELDLQVTAGGIFDQGSPVPGTETVGRVRLEVRDCTRIIMSYEHDEPPLSGTIPLQRIVTDNAALCEALDSISR